MRKKIKKRIRSIVGTDVRVGRRINAKMFLAVVFLFGAAGVLLLMRILAAGPIMSIQGEGTAQSRSGNLVSQNDQAASDGSYVQFGADNSAAPCGGQTPPKAGGGTWQCTWHDEFNGTSLDSSKWRPMKWTYSMTCFTAGAPYVEVGGGNLTLRAVRQPGNFDCENYSEQQDGRGNPLYWRSGGLTTEDTFGQRYGRFEARIKLPPGPGTFPAFWLDPMFESNGKPYHGDWPWSGEIDIMESYENTGSNDVAICNYHHMAPWSNNNISNRAQNSTYIQLSPKGGWHTFTLEWKPNELRYLMNGQVCQVYTNWTPHSPLSNPAPFDRPFFIMLTFGMGNNWGFEPVPAGTPNPSEFVIDYVRVWQ